MHLHHGASRIQCTELHRIHSATALGWEVAYWRGGLYSEGYHVRSDAVDVSDEGGDAEREEETRRLGREELEARVGRGLYVAGAAWDEGNMVRAMRRFGGQTIGWRFGDG